MAALSIYDGNGPAKVIASPIYVIGAQHDEIVFEVLEVDAHILRSHVGVDAYYVMGSEEAHWGRVVSLEVSQSPESVLSTLSDSPILKGVLKTYQPEQTGTH